MLFYLLKEPTTAPSHRARHPQSLATSKHSKTGRRVLVDTTETGNVMRIHAAASPEHVFELIEMKLGKVSRTPGDIPTLYVRYFGETAMRVIFASTTEEVFTYRIDWVAERVGIHEYTASMNVQDQQNLVRYQDVAKRTREAVSGTLRSLDQPASR
ncbi:hypothetical protein [Stomatohabitans albus]|uniref:hypothetical protein n=1 Tax=Stomatohabitans albus TaxID=3110766 RepID=UPI00300CFF94